MKPSPGFVDYRQQKGGLRTEAEAAAQNTILDINIFYHPDFPNLAPGLYPACPARQVVQGGSQAEDAEPHPGL